MAFRVCLMPSGASPAACSTPTPPAAPRWRAARRRRRANWWPGAARRCCAARWMARCGSAMCAPTTARPRAPMGSVRSSSPPRACLPRRPPRCPHGRLRWNATPRNGTNCVTTSSGPRVRAWAGWTSISTTAPCPSVSASACATRCAGCGRVLRRCWCWPGGRSSFPTASTCTTSRRRSASMATARPMLRGAPSMPSTMWRWRYSRLPTASPSPRCRAMQGRAGSGACPGPGICA